MCSSIGLALVISIPEAAWMVSVFHINLDVEMVDIPKYMAGAIGDEQMSKR